MLSDLADELALEMSFAPGDIQFVNNHVIYHARTAFADDAAAGHDRLLLRLRGWRCRTAAPCRTGTRSCGAPSSPGRCAAALARPRRRRCVDAA